VSSNRGEALIQQLQKQTEEGALVWTRDTDTQAYADSKDRKFRFLLRRSERNSMEVLVARAQGKLIPESRHLLSIHPFQGGEVQPKPTVVLDEGRRPDLASDLRKLWSTVQDAIDLPPLAEEQVLESILGSS
jgi:hypothetical protein